jgi:hypothetical protein
MEIPNTLLQKYQLARILEISLEETRKMEEKAKQKIIDDFVKKLKEERGSETHYINKQGKKVKLAPITFMSTKMRLIAMDVAQLNAFYYDCERHTNFKTFTMYYMCKTKI